MAIGVPRSTAFILLVLILLQSTGQGACGSDDPESPPKMRERLASNVTLPCLFSRLPAPSIRTPSSIRWSRVPIQSNTGEQLVLEAVDGTIHWGEGFQDRAEMLGYAYNHCDTSLTLTGLRSSDSGIYRCEVTLGVESEHHTVPLVVSGAVFHYRTPSAHEGLTFSQAQQACLDNSAQVASPAQLLAAFWDGYESCDTGWLSDHTVSVSIQSPRPGCYSDRDSSPGVRSLGYRDLDELFDVYCYIEELQGEVFHSTVPGKLSLVRAAAHCRALGAHLATAGQLHLAWRAGLDHCDPGWLADGSVRFPIVQPRAGCGGAEPGIRTLYHNADLTGVPASSALFDAYCYREQEASRQFLHTESRFPASHNEASVTPPPSSSSNLHDPESPKQADLTDHEQEEPPPTDGASPQAVGSQSKPRWSDRVDHVGSEGPLEGSVPGPTLHSGQAGLQNPGSQQLISGGVNTGEDEEEKGHQGQFLIPSSTPKDLNGDHGLPSPLSAIVTPRKRRMEDSTAPPGTAVQKDTVTPPGMVMQEDEGTEGAAAPVVAAGEGADGSHWPLYTPQGISTEDTVDYPGSPWTSAPGPAGPPSPLSSETRGEAQWTPESDQNEAGLLDPEDIGKTITLGFIPVATAASKPPGAMSPDTPEGYSGEDQEQESNLAAQPQRESDGRGLDQAAVPLAGSPGEAWKGDATAEVRGEILYSRQPVDAKFEPVGTTTPSSITGYSITPSSPVTADSFSAEDDESIHKSHFSEVQQHSVGSEESSSKAWNRRPSVRGSTQTPQAPQAQPVPSQQPVEHGTVITLGSELHQANGTQLFPDVDNCQSNPCQNGGTCIDKVDSFVCLCLPSYGGATCEKDTEGCDHGWKKFHAHCYRYFPRRRTWENAEKDCREHGAHLASVHSAAEQDFLAGLSHENTWIGLNDRTVEEDFQWTDNMELEYENWREKQPDNFFAGGEDCVVMVAHEDGRWNDVPCNYNLPYVCKKGTVLCGPPPSVENTILIGRKRESYDIHSVVRYQCADGFLQRHIPTAKCRANGRWDRPRIVCAKAGRRSHRHRRHHHKSHRERRKHRKHRGGAHSGHTHTHTHM